MTDIYKKISELNSKYGNESSEFEEKTKNNFFKNTKEFEKHNELVYSLSF